jgi:hypothetical protein
MVLNNIYKIIIVFGIAIGFFLYGSIFHRDVEFYNPRGVWEICWKDGPVETYSIPDWNNKTQLIIDFIRQGSSNCQGMYHPVIRSTYLDSIKWIHIVEVTIAAEKQGIGWQLVDDMDKWVFIDAQPQYRSQDDPFYSTSNVFHDNPAWSKQAANFKWIGYVFPVLVEGTKLTPIGGFSWGFEYLKGNAYPTGILPSKITRAAWEKYRLEMAKNYPKWTFM